PDRLHAQLGVLEHLDVADAVLGQAGGGPADRAEVEAAVAGAGVGDLLRAVALGEHHVGAAGGLEPLVVGVHPARRGGADGPRGVPVGGLGRAGVVDAALPQVLGHGLAGVEPLGDLGVGDVAGHDHGPGERQAGLHRVLGQLGADLGHRAVQVEAHDAVAELV